MLRNAREGTALLRNITDALTQAWTVSPTTGPGDMVLLLGYKPVCAACNRTKQHEIKPRTEENDAIPSSCCQLNKA